MELKKRLTDGKALYLFHDMGSHFAEVHIFTVRVISLNIFSLKAIDTIAQIKGNLKEI
jgi:hypothetical protein